MKTTWIGLILLSASWLWGLEYTHDAQPGIWIIMVVLGVSLVRSQRGMIGSCKQAWLGLAMTLPACVLIPGVYRIGAAVLLLACLLAALPWPNHVRRWSGHLFLSGLILLVQALALVVYLTVTARDHSLPVPLRHLLATMAAALGFESVLQGPYLAVHTMRQVFPLNLSWDLLWEPAAFAWFWGAVTVLWAERRQGWSIVFVGLLVWLPLQMFVQIAWLMQRALRSGYDESVTIMAPFWNPWVQLVLLTGLGWVLARSRPRSSAVSAVRPSSPKALLGLGLSVMLLTLGLLWDPPGMRKAGRVWVDEHHSTWEPTQRPFDTEWYGHDSGYNYACIYDYCGHFYDMNRVTTSLDDQTLQDCDVLMIKTPTERYQPQEVAAIRNFVRQGGGLLLVGEHTNVFNTGTYLNDIAQEFGFRFVDDCLFDIDTPFEEDLRPTTLAHPVIRHIPFMDFAVSCSIDPGFSPGRAAIESIGLRHVPADYHVSNFYPQVEDRADSQVGAFVQLWTRRYGQGRVAAFTDSTIFSNFATFEPGKPELMLGMLAWLNHRNAWGRPHLILLGLGLLGLIMSFRTRRSWGPLTVVIPVLLLSWSVGAATVEAVEKITVPLPAVQRDYVSVVMDRTVCDTILPRSGFIAGDARGFGIFERWILRLGYFTSRRQGPAAFDGDLLIFTYPTGTVTDTFRQQLIDYVEQGGRVLVIDGPANTGSTANSLLYPFGLSLTSNAGLRNITLTSPQDWPTGVQVQASDEVKGGDPLITAQGTPVAAQVTHGRGTVTVLGFGGRFCDQRMGVTGDVEPDATLRNVYELEYRMLRDLITEHEGP